MRQLFVIIGLTIWIVAGIAEIVSLAPPTVGHAPIESGETNKKCQGPEKREPSFVRVIFCKVGLFIDGNRDDISASSTLVIAIFTVILGVATVLLVRSGQDTARRQLRAYVCINEVTTTPHAAAGFQKWKVQCAVKNYGVTPAYELRGWADTALRKVPFHGGLVKTESADEDHGRALIGPGEGYAWEPILNELPFSQQQLSDLKDGTLGIYVFGRVDYQDTFGKDRFLTFRLVSTGHYPGQSNFAACPEGNNAN